MLKSRRLKSVWRAAQLLAGNLRPFTDAKSAAVNIYVSLIEQLTSKSALQYSGMVKKNRWHALCNQHFAQQRY